jgi:RecG-like helicase
MEEQKKEDNISNANSTESPQSNQNLQSSPLTSPKTNQQPSFPPSNSKYSQEPNYPSPQQFKRNIAYKFANIIDKFIQEGEKKFASITLDDASGQIKVKTFGDDIEKFTPLQQGDTIQLIGLLRYWNNEVYLTPEIIKKKDPQFLLVRKLEIDSLEPKSLPKEQLTRLKDKILQKLRESEKNNEQGLEIESLILELKESPDIINSEIKKLLEDGMAYEPRPGKLRYLG